MWSCPHCGNQHGMMFEDQQMSGMLCMHPDCGRVDVLTAEEIRNNREQWADSDM